MIFLGVISLSHIIAALPVSSVSLLIIYVNLDHKTSHKGQFFEIEIYASEI